MLLDKLKAYPFYLLPHHAISRLMYRLARVESKSVKNLAIRVYTRLNPVNMTEAVDEDPYSYSCLNAFFTRALKPECRPFADQPDWLCPVDGSVSQAEPIAHNRLLQAKGHYYTVEQLLGGDSDLAKAFHDGSFTTLYLSPRDYHRIHMPIAGKLRLMRYIPGRLFSVADHTVNEIPGLFARNERCVCLFDTDEGQMALVLVGAINVSAIETSWHGIVKHREITDYTYSPGDVSLQRGDEMGRFNLGSTVIVLAQKGMEWHEDISAGREIRMGQALGRMTAAGTD